MKAVNLIPAEQRGGTPVGAGRSEGVAYAVLALIGGVAVLTVLYAKSSHEVSNRRAQVASLHAKVAAEQAAATTLAPYTSFVAMREQRKQAVETLVDARFDWAHAFHELGRVIPATANLSSLTGQIGSTSGPGSSSSSSSGSAASTSAASTSAASTSASTSSSSSAAGGAGTATSATPAGSVPTFTLAGCAVSQAAVAETLDRLRLMDGVSSVTLESSTKTANSGGGGGGCASNEPAFTIQVAFQPLPTSTAIAAASSSATHATVSDTTAAGSAPHAGAGSPR
jgi:hypothetical protein